MNTLSERQMEYLRQTALLPRSAPAPVWYTNVNFLSCLAVGDGERADGLIREKADLCITFTSDCADFLLNLLIRALILFPDRISPDNRERIRKAALCSRYYGGHRRQYPMFYNSENHHMSWATAELLGAQLYPEEVFTFDGRTSRAHYDRARFLVANWIDRRGRWGYSEFNSAPYMGINLMSLLNLADFAADPDIRKMGADGVTKLLADVAADSAAGGVWGAQARSYEPYVFGTDAQPAAAALRILLGAGDAAALEPIGGIGEAIATTAYRPPEWLCRLADASSGPLVNEERHRTEKDLFYSCRSAFWRPPFELTREEARQAFAPDSLHDVALRTERTPEYLVSAVLLPREHPMAQADAQALYWMGCLNGNLSIFTTQPFVPSAPEAAARYWAGTASVPRCYVGDGIAAAVYAGGKLSEDFTHAHFPVKRMEAWEQRGNWFLGRAGDAYVGLLAPAGAELTREGPWADREIKAPGRQAVWLAVFGSRTRDGGFAAFAGRCAALPVTIAPDRLSVEWQAGDVVVRVSHADGIFIGRQPFSCADWPQMNNGFVRSGYGEPVGRLPDGSAGPAWDFSAAVRLCAEWERND